MIDNGNPIPMHLREKTKTKNERINLAERQASKLNDPEMRKFRRQQMVMSRVMGMNNKQIGKIFNLTGATVAQEINKAKKEGVLDSLNERILDELVPDAIAVYKKKLLEEDDAFVAKDVLKHLERLTNRKDEKEKSESVQYSMQAYIQSKQQLPNGQIVNIQQTLKGEATKALLEQGNMEPVPSEGMQFLEGVVVEEEDNE
jgi:DNA-binding transcriptional regulator LsrR (DeoR family)